MACSHAAFFIIACCAVSVQSSRANLKAIVDQELEQVEGAEQASVGLIQVDGEDILVLDDNKANDGFKCGALTDTTAACYPASKNGWTSSGDKAACTSQCTLKEGIASKVAGVVFEGLPPSKHCSCPTSGEKCRSVLDKNPGVETAYTNGISWTGPVKVNKATGTWQYLKMDEAASFPNGRNKKSPGIVWKWKSPPRGKLSFVQHSQVMTPSIGELKTVLGEKVGASPDFCDPSIAGRYFNAIQN